MNEEKILLTLSKDLKDKLKKLANDKNISLNSLIRIALSEYLERSQYE